MTNFRRAALLAALIASVVVGPAPWRVPAVAAAEPAKPAISKEASAALAQMGASLEAKAFSFQARTIRAYSAPNKQLLHILHVFKVTVRRPDRLLVDVAGDDGTRKVMYDGSTLVLALGDGKRYASIPVPNTIQGMLQVAVGHFGVDFPLADFLTDAPAKSFLTGVTAGREVDTVTIDGVPCRHLVFSQPPGIELELWLEKNEQSLPRRLIVTYRTLPGEPNFIAEMSDWNFTIHPPDADFAFQPPEGAVQVEPTPAMAAKGMGGNQ